MLKDHFPKLVFGAVLFFCLTPWASPPLALALGLVLAMTLGHPYKKYNSMAVKYLLQASVVGLGFGMNFSEVVDTGKNGIFFTVCSIAGTLIAGYILGRLLAVPKKNVLSCICWNSHLRRERHCRGCAYH